jgi:mannose-6-phosphate isomerase-like protein (cupin superfamily)
MSTHIRTADLEDSGRAWGRMKSIFDGSAVVPGSGFSFGTISYEAPHHSGRHDDHEALYVLRGEGIARIGSERIPITAGSFLHIPKGVDHGITDILSGPIECILIHFS